jgi:hypothetical protein
MDQVHLLLEFIGSYGVAGYLVTALLGVITLNVARAVIFRNPKVRTGKE